MNDERPGRGHLVIVGDTAHAYDDDGRLCTHAALASQLDLWCAHFEQVTFCGTLLEGPPPAEFGPYRADNVELAPLRQSGGDGLRAKAGVVVAAFGWLGTIVPKLAAADVVHLRTPCNVTAVTIPVARVVSPRRYAMFAGSWEAYAGEPWSYRLQRWLLRRAFGGVVHAYVPPGTGSDQGHVRANFSPVVTRARLDVLTNGRPPRAPVADRPIEIVCVGRFSANKNQMVLVEALRVLERAGVAARCTFIGDGVLRDGVARAARDLPAVRFEPALRHDDVLAAMAEADLCVLPSHREGYPKVLLEGLSAGALPVAADTAMNRSIADGRGWVFDPGSATELAEVIRTARDLAPDRWAAMRASAAAYAAAHTLDAFGAEIDDIIDELRDPAARRVGARR